MLSREDKDRYIEVLLALGGYNKQDTKEGVSDDSIEFHNSGVRPIQETMQFCGERA